MRAETLSVYLCPFYVLTPIGYSLRSSKLRHSNAPKTEISVKSDKIRFTKPQLFQFRKKILVNKALPPLMAVMDGTWL